MRDVELDPPRACGIQGRLAEGAVLETHFACLHAEIPGENLANDPVRGDEAPPLEVGMQPRRPGALVRAQASFQSELVPVAGVARNSPEMNLVPQGWRPYESSETRSLNGRMRQKRSRRPDRSQRSTTSGRLGHRPQMDVGDPRHPRHPQAVGQGPERLLAGRGLTQLVLGAPYDARVYEQDLAPACLQQAQHGLCQNVDAANVRPVEEVEVGRRHGRHGTPQLAAVAVDEKIEAHLLAVKTRREPADPSFSCVLFADSLAPPCSQTPLDGEGAPPLIASPVHG